ncbi:MAG: hypothetical protein HYR91_03525 [Flavobacteriia bacterium]|nr:hypothetical protein [Flavobacteriia bacterium]
MIQNNKQNYILENLYTVFAKYQSSSFLIGSPIYDDIEIWKKTLKNKKLHELNDDDLSRFVGKAMSTWGNENDFKYYLPRILELCYELQAPYDINIIYSKLEDANWRNWNSIEQKSIYDFSIELWTNLLNNSSEKAIYEFKNYFHTLMNFHPNFTELLHLWTLNNQYASIKHLVNYILEEKQFIFDLNYINSTPKNYSKIIEFKSWLLSETVNQKIENSFFENPDSDIAEKCSWAQQILIFERNLLK